MRKKIAYSCLAAFIVLVLGIALCLNSMFPLARAVVCADVMDITSFSVEYDNAPIELSELCLGGILVHLKMAEPTRKLSLDDNPSVRPYYKITVDTNDWQYRYFIYEQGGAFYLELPYEGIYILNDDVSSLLEQDKS
ncbi:MAG: DUF5301 domain-containing protein [Rikenellaceae bacterium]